jgi:membrane protein CcdC involved in cytochrome C biogenesis
MLLNIRVAYLWRIVTYYKYKNIYKDIWKLISNLTST